jgi:ribonuclease HI
MAKAKSCVDDVITIHTDGSCKGNPGPGGWAYHIAKGPRRKLGSGGEVETTNNRMELRAAIEGLSALKVPDLHLVVVTDSAYLRNGITRWIENWKARGWRTGTNKPVKNVDLWQRLERVASAHHVEWVWCRGHSGVAGNELVDRAASAAAERARPT